VGNQATRKYLLLQRNLVYTGITRGKKLVVGRAIVRCPDRDWMILQMQ
jgi:ATP-dependent exoDNAse (exonuclease V) alpha subunit